MLKINLIITPLPLAPPPTYPWTSAASYLSPWLHSYPGLSIFHRAARVLLFRSKSDHASLTLRTLLWLSSAWRWNLKLFLLPVKPHISRLSYSLFSHFTPGTQISLHFPKLTANFPDPESLPWFSPCLEGLPTDICLSAHSTQAPAQRVLLI